MKVSLDLLVIGASTVCEGIQQVIVPFLESFMLALTIESRDVSHPVKA